ncbi:hypothetical protein DDI_3896 [Dickeya dianthicola RNS04.9]|nr:hypothetical protein DDI_3896 [Dickeya dianthicola RNS04.9]
MNCPIFTLKLNLDADILLFSLPIHIGSTLNTGAGNNAAHNIFMV